MHDIVWKEEVLEFTVRYTGPTRDNPGSGAGSESIICSSGIILGGAPEVFKRCVD